MGITKRIFRGAYTLLHKLLTGCYNTLHVHPFLLCFLLGSAGVLMDADHLISRSLQMGRPFHIPVFIAIWFVFGCFFTYHYRRVHNVSVGEKNDNIN